MGEPGGWQNSVGTFVRFRFAQFFPQRCRAIMKFAIATKATSMALSLGVYIGLSYSVSYPRVFKWALALVCLWLYAYFKSVFAWVQDALSEDDKPIGEVEISS